MRSMFILCIILNCSKNVNLSYKRIEKTITSQINIFKIYSSINMVLDKKIFK